MVSEMSVECTEVITMAMDKFASSSNFEVSFSNARCCGRLYVCLLLLAAAVRIVRFVLGYASMSGCCNPPGTCPPASHP